MFVVDETSLGEDPDLVRIVSGDGRHYELLGDTR